MKLPFTCQSDDSIAYSSLMTLQDRGFSIHVKVSEKPSDREVSICSGSRGPNNEAVYIQKHTIPLTIIVADLNVEELVRLAHKIEHWVNYPCGTPWCSLFQMDDDDWDWRDNILARYGDFSVELTSKKEAAKQIATLASSVSPRRRQPLW